MRWAALFGMGLLMLTGCWDQRPVEGRALVEAVGVAPTNRTGLWQWTFVSPSPTESTDTMATAPAQEVYAITVRARTWTGALLAAQQETTRDLYFGQFRVLALSPRIPAPMFGRLIATFNRSGRILKTFWIVVAHPVSSVVATPPITEGTPLYGLFKLLSCHCQPYTWGQRAWQTWDRMATSGVTPILPMIQLIRQNVIQNREMAVLGSHGLQVWSPDASIGWAYLTQHVVKGGITVPTKMGRVGLNRIRGTSHVSFSVRGSTVHLTDRLSYHGAVEDVPPALALTPATKQAIATAVAGRILSLSQSAVDTAEHDQVDPFGWHRDVDWALNQPGRAWPAPIPWTDWVVRLRVEFHVRGEGVSH